jgi:hypothetical protein
VYPRETTNKPKFKTSHNYEKLPKNAKKVNLKQILEERIQMIPDNRYLIEK